MVDKDLKERITTELKDAGMTSYGLMKFETAYLPHVIHENEHVKAVVYGRLEGTIDSVMLVATNQRVLFLNCKPFYKDWDEITYEVVAGVRISMAGMFAGVVLHTRVKDYELRYVNLGCAKKFVDYIGSYVEKQELKRSGIGTEPEKTKGFPSYKMKREKETKAKEHHSNETTTILDDTAVLSTSDENAEVHASVVHYVIDKDDNFYFLTKTDTKKVKNLEQNNVVALTIHPSQSLQVLYVKGKAELVQNKLTKQQVFDHIIEPKSYKEGVKLPPITQIETGAYIAYKITPTSRYMHDYSQTSW